MLERDDVIASWAREQLSPWLTRGPVALTHAALRQACADHAEMFLFEINHGSVQVDRGERPSVSPWAEDIQPRVSLYTEWLETVTRTLCPEITTTLAICVGDHAIAAPDVPVFAFQKPIHGSAILLPDPDLLRFGFDLPDDRLPFEAKASHAIFVGSTSGNQITQALLDADDTLPRIAAAKFLQSYPEVTFKLPVLCQYDGPETEQRLRAMGFGDGERVGWADMFQNRFIFSMDGNGASCSRVMTTLGSNSVLLKYKSENVLYYFSGLRPWLHYVPIVHYAELVETVRLEQRQPGYHAPLSRTARRFQTEYLTRGAVMLYTARILRTYASWLSANAS